MQQSKGFGQHLPAAVIEDAQRGEQHAFETIYRTYAPACFSLARRILGDSAAAEDVTQECFVKVMQNINKFRGEGVFAGWLRRMAVNETITRLRQGSRLQWLDEVAPADSLSSDLFSTRWLEACHDVEKLLSQLTPKSRAVLLLHEVEGLNHKEIAELFGQSESFSKVTLSRAYQQLQSLVADAAKEKIDAPN